MNTTRNRFRPSAALVAGVMLMFLPGAQAQHRPVLMTMEVRGMQALVEDVNRISMALQFGPQGAIMWRALDRMTGGSGFEGIDTNGTIQVVMFQPDLAAGPGSKPAVLLLPVTGTGDAFSSLLDDRLTRLADADGGLRRYEAPARGGRSEDLYMASREGLAVLGADADLVSEVLTQLESGTLTAGTRIDQPGSVAMDLNVGALSGLMRETMGKLATLDSGGEMAKVQKQLDAFAGLIAQVQGVQLGLDTDSRSLVLSSRMMATPGSVLAGCLAATRAPRPLLYALLPEGLMLSQAGHVGDVDGALELYRSMLSSVFSAMGPDGDHCVAYMDAALTDVKGLLTGEYAMGLDAGDTGNRMHVAYAFGITDPKRFDATLDRLVSGVAQLGAMPDGSRVSVNELPGRTHRDVPVRQLHYTLALGAIGAPDGEMPGMLGAWTNLVYEVACAGDVALVATGDPAQLDAMLDQALGVGTGVRPLLEDPLFKTLFADDPAVAGADQLVVLSLVDYVKFTVGMMPGMDASMLAMFPSSSSGMAGYSLTRGNQQDSIIKVGFEEMAAVKSMVPFLMMGAMATRGGGMGGGMGGGAGYEDEPSAGGPEADDLGMDGASADPEDVEADPQP